MLLLTGWVSGTLVRPMVVGGERGEGGCTVTAIDAFDELGQLRLRRTPNEVRDAYLELSGQVNQCITNIILTSTEI